jgi:hypothetical protein
MIVSFQNDITLTDGTLRSAVDRAERPPEVFPFGFLQLRFDEFGSATLHRPLNLPPHQGEDK